MAKGGARANSGPPPDPNALRRDRPDDQGTWTDLPKAGRQGKAPEWPLSPPTVSRIASTEQVEAGLPLVMEVLLEGDQERELALWELEWRRPQAVMWERNGQEVEVALYVRALVAAEKADAKTPSRTLVKQLQEALGLSIPGLMRNRWRIIGGDIAEATKSDAKPARAGMKVVAGGS